MLPKDEDREIPAADREEKYEFNAPMFVDFLKDNEGPESDIPPTAYGSESNLPENTVVGEQEEKSISGEQRKKDETRKKTRQTTTAQFKSEKKPTFPREFRLGERKNVKIPKKEMPLSRTTSRKTTRPIPFAFQSETLSKKVKEEGKKDKAFRARPVPIVKTLLIRKTTKQATVPKAPTLGLEARLKERQKKKEE